MYNNDPVSNKKIQEDIEIITEIMISYYEIHFSYLSFVNFFNEIVESIIIDYGKEDRIISIEILNSKQRNLNLNDLIDLTVEEIIPKTVQCQ